MRLSGTTRDGVQNRGMLKAISSVGFSAKILKEINFLDLRKLIDNKKVVIVVWWSGSWGHYSVVTKVNKKYIFLADPNTGAIRKLSLKEFDHLWFDFSKDYDRSPSDLELRTAILIER